MEKWIDEILTSGLMAIFRSLLRELCLTKHFFAFFYISTKCRKTFDLSTFPLHYIYIKCVQKFITTKNVLFEKTPAGIFTYNIYPLTHIHIHTYICIYS